MKVKSTSLMMLVLFAVTITLLATAFASTPIHQAQNTSRAWNDSTIRQTTDNDCADSQGFSADTPIIKGSGFSADTPIIKGSGYSDETPDFIGDTPRTMTLSCAEQQ